MGRKFAAGSQIIKPKATPAVVPSQYNRDDLTPQSRPHAVSHDASLFDALHSHIEEISNRLENAQLSSKEQKNRDYVRVLSTVRAHLNEARKHFGNAYAAHATGGPTAEAKLRAGHTAVESYRRAVTHVADALNFMRGEAGFGPRINYEEPTPVVEPETGKTRYDVKPKISPTGSFEFQRHGISRLGLKILSNDGRPKLATHHELNELVNGYQTHVRSSLQKAGVEIPEGVADKPADFKVGAEPSELSRQTLGKKGIPLTYTEELATKAKRRGVKQLKAAVRQKELSVRTGRTHVLDESNQPVVKSGEPNPYAGVGITGHSALLDAVAKHYNKTFATEKTPFIGSEAHQNPVEYAKKFNIKLPGQEDVVRTALTRMGRTTAGVTPGQLNRDIEQQPAGVPKLSKKEVATMGEANVPKKGRATTFSEQVEGAKS